MKCEGGVMKDLLVSYVAFHLPPACTLGEIKNEL